MYWNSFGVSQAPWNQTHGPLLPWQSRDRYLQNNLRLWINICTIPKLIQWKRLPRQSCIQGPYYFCFLYAREKIPVYMNQLQIRAFYRKTLAPWTLWPSIVGWYPLVIVFLIFILTRPQCGKKRKCASYLPQTPQKIASLSMEIKSLYINR